MKRNAKFKRSMEAVALILPTVLIYTLVIAYPLLNMTYTSFFTWDGIPTVHIRGMGKLSQILY